MVVFWTAWQESPHKLPPPPGPRVDAEVKSGDGSQISLPWRHMVFPRLLKPAEIIHEVISRKRSVSSEELGNS